MIVVSEYAPFTFLSLGKPILRQMLIFLIRRKWLWGTKKTRTITGKAAWATKNTGAWTKRKKTRRLPGPSSGFRTKFETFSTWRNRKRRAGKTMIKRAPRKKT